jgi:FdhD protein
VTAQGRASDERQVLRVRDGAASSDRDRVAVEAPLEIRVGGKPLTVVMRTPGHDEELVRGFLFSEGVGDILSLRQGDENVVEVQLQPPPVSLGRSAVPERSFFASSSCGVCGKTSIADLEIKSPPVSRTLTTTRAVLSSLPAALRAAQAVFDETGGLHASGLFDAAGTLLASREDVGRHNALDKLIGWSLGAHPPPLADLMLMVSGRVSFEILQKAIAAGLPLVAAVSAPSSLAIDLAERYGVTLVGFLRGASMNVYTHPQRLIDTPTRG